MIGICRQHRRRPSPSLYTKRSSAGWPQKSYAKPALTMVAAAAAAAAAAAMLMIVVVVVVATQARASTGREDKHFGTAEVFVGVR